MAYQANRDGNQNEKNVGADRVRGTANVLKHSANPYAKAAGVADDFDSWIAACEKLAAL